jgi:predicted phage terminase large subunit-like protein
MAIELPAGIDRDAQLADLDRADQEDSLYLFLKAAWRYIDPAQWRDSWAVEAICEHLQAVVDGEIKRLIINCPPRIGKSNTVSVAFPAWTWAQSTNNPTCGPGVPFLYASYADKLSLRDSVKCRRLIESPWYQARWGNRFQLTTDQNTKSRFTNDKGGDRLITSIGAGVTGEGGNIICIDDPNAANDVESEATTENTITWWTTAMPTRLNDPMNGAFIIIQQRLGEDDLTGHILEHEADGWTHLCLPGRYEPERSFHTSIGWTDPRTEPGELLWPERFSEEYLKRLEKSMGPFTFAGQIQQRPEPKGGGIILREWWKLWEPESYPPMDYIIGCLDTAYTEDTMNDPSGMIVWGIFSGNAKASATQIGATNFRGEIQTADGKPFIRPDPTYSEFAPQVMCMWAWDDHLALHELVQRVAQTCVKMKVDLLLIENKASGISVAQEIRRLYWRERFGVELFDPKSQDKTARLYSVQHLFAEGIIHGPDRPWMEKVITQVGMHPKGKHDEFVDLTSMGLRKLRDIGLLVRQPERDADLEAQKIYPGSSEDPLYPV